MSTPTPTPPVSATDRRQVQTAAYSVEIMAGSIRDLAADAVASLLCRARSSLLQLQRAAVALARLPVVLPPAMFGGLPVPPPPLGAGVETQSAAEAPRKGREV